MNMEHLQPFIDLRKTDIDPEVFAAALTIHYVSKLIASGGSSIGQPDLESVLPPQQVYVGMKDQAISIALIIDLITDNSEER